MSSSYSQPHYNAQTLVNVIFSLSTGYAVLYELVTTCSNFFHNLMENMFGLNFNSNFMLIGSLFAIVNLPISWKRLLYCFSSELSNSSTPSINNFYLRESTSKVVIVAYA